MSLNINTVIYGYMALCIILLLYNLFYILRTKMKKGRIDRTAGAWEKEISEQLERYHSGERAEQSHLKKLRKKLVSTNALLAYGTALDQIAVWDDEFLELYMNDNISTFQILAAGYKKKDSMDRAYFSYLLSRHQPCKGEHYTPLMEILLSFLEDSTVYCRENVLQALYSFGNSQAVETAFQIFHDRQWFHHPKLLSDGLLTFGGDKEELAARLWKHWDHWNRNLMLSVVQFIAGFSDQYKETFFPLLMNQDTDMEIRLAVLRYYRRYAYEPVKNFLLSCLTDRTVNENLAIVAASVADAYPGADTLRALKQALQHSNWYVRYNAAATIAETSVSVEELRDILDGTDKYAVEILSYMLEERRTGEEND